MTDISFTALFSDAANYRITGTFDGVDLVNGGRHNAVDVGNFGMNDPILSPVTDYARGLVHFDGAIGIEYQLPDDWTLELWHLNATLAPVGSWQVVVKGQVCGRTGNTGALVNGQPMPAHTHIVLYSPERIPVDAAPYLLGKDFSPGEGEPMYNPRDVLSIYGLQLTTLSGVNVREKQGTSYPVVTTLGPGTALTATARIVGESVAGVIEWYEIKVEVAGQVRTGYVHSSTVKAEPQPLVDLFAAEQKGYANAKAAALRAVEGI